MGRRPKTHVNRRHQFLDPKQGRQDRLLMVLGIAGLAVVVLVGVAMFSGRGTSSGFQGTSSLPAELLPAGRDVRLAAALFVDGRARFYRYTTSLGREIRFFVIRSADGVVRAAFDACDVCYRSRKGYRQDGDDMVCVNCGQRFRSSDVNLLAGGCNPAPLRRAADGAQVVIKAADLDLGSAYF